MANTSDYVSPKPLPQIFNNFNNLTTKKEKYSVTPKVRNIPPPAPFKSSSKVSRLSFNNSFHHQYSSKKAQVITFKSNSPVRLSKLYDESSNASYFEQCFIIEEKIGSGSFGDVFKVKSREDGNYYAVKVSKEKFKGRADREERLNEVRKHEQLPKHEHLVELFCAWEEKQRLFIQTELCTTSLSTLADNNHEIPEETIWGYLVDLLKAIDHLHSNDLIHLDIKPDNIFISQDSKCKLGDLGLVYDVRNNDESIEATEGDPKYLASEVIQGIYSKAADIFSLGMTILELASDLDLPSRGPSWHVLRSPGQIPDSVFQKISPDLKNIILLMIHPEYQQRPSAQELLNHPIVVRWWAKVSQYLNRVFTKTKTAISTSNQHGHQLKNTSRERSRSPPKWSRSSPNFNRSYVSNYLDLYSDDDDSYTSEVMSSPTRAADHTFRFDDVKTRLFH